jgi:DNA-binding transcriptional LysR family regulator
MGMEAMDLGRLKIFYTLVKAGSFTKAAKILNISQPAVTHAIQLFEHNVKATLIKRSTRGFTLTPEGERVFELATKVTEETDDFWKTFRDNDTDAQGEIKIITTPSFGETDLLYSLLPYLNERPNLKIKILTSREEYDIEHADVAIRSFVPNRPDLEQLLLQTFHIKLWASPEYLEKYGTPQSPSDLDQHKLLAFGFQKSNPFHHTNQIDWILKVGINGGKIRKPFLSITSHQGLYNAACKGYGIIQLPKETIKFRDSTLVPVLNELEEPIIEYYFVCNKRLAKTTKIIALYQYLRKSFQQAS